MRKSERPPGGNGTAAAGFLGRIEQRQVIPLHPRAQAHTFDYAVLPAAIADQARDAAARIRARMRDDVLQIGADLIAVKRSLGHGQWSAWLSKEIDISERTAQRYMNAARWAEGKSDIVSVLTPTVIYHMSAPSVPARVQENLLQRLGRGEHLDGDVVATLVDHAKIEDDQARRDDRKAQKRLAQREARAKAKLQTEQDKQALKAREEAKAAAEELAIDKVVDFLRLHLGDHLQEYVDLCRQVAPWKIRDRLELLHEADRDPHHSLRHGRGE